MSTRYQAIPEETSNGPLYTSESTGETTFSLGKIGHCSLAEVDMGFGGSTSVGSNSDDGWPDDDKPHLAHLSKLVDQRPGFMRFLTTIIDKVSNNIV
jgi:hypothetical protein